MKLYPFVCAVLLLACTDKKQSGDALDFDQHWRFKLGTIPGASDSSFDDHDWRVLDVPHDWSIEGAFDEKNPATPGGGALPGGTGWYRKSFGMSSPPNDGRIFIEFDGVYRNSEVWLNGHLLGKRPNGYISFHYDLTPFLNVNGRNQLAVKVDNSEQPNSRWYSGSGIFRNVRLIAVPGVYVDRWTKHITTPEISAARAKTVVATRLINSTHAAQRVKLTTHFYTDDREEAGEVTTEETVPADSSLLVTQEYSINNPQLWSVENPHQYVARSTLEQDGKKTDEFATYFGIRFFKFDKDRGFSLNGKSFKIKGVCLHHDLGCLGAALNTRALERQLEIMKAMGVNGIRTTHNPPAPELLTLCDKMGFIVMDEAFDIWKKQKNPYDYHLDWDAWHRRDLEDQILRDRNHASVLIWSVGNEVVEQRNHADSLGADIARELVSIVKQLDTSRPITAATDDVGYENPLTHSGAMDLVGYNYHHTYYEAFQKDHPGRSFIGTETSSALATRGYYDMPSDSIRRWPIAWDKPFVEGNPGNTVSAYDNVSAPWGSTHEETWKLVKKHDYLSGIFIWTGFDYLGEPTPYGWPSRSSYFGVVDLAGFPKDAYYMYQSEWTGQPVLHLFPHWNWMKGQTVDVWAYYNNADEVELFVNEKSAGVRKKTGDDLHVMWRIPYDSGTLRAVSRKDGKEVLTRKIKTAGAAARIVLKADRMKLKADGKDLCFVTATIVDEHGTAVPHADNLLKFEVVGEGTFEAADNGDPVSHESFKVAQHKAFHGLCLVVLKSKPAKGKIALRVTSEGLRRGSVNVDVW